MYTVISRVNVHVQSYNIYNQTLLETIMSLFRKEKKKYSQLVDKDFIKKKNSTEIFPP